MAIFDARVVDHFGIRRVIERERNLLNSGSAILVDGIAHLLRLLADRTHRLSQQHVRAKDTLVVRAERVILDQERPDVSCVGVAV